MRSSHYRQPGFGLLQARSGELGLATPINEMTCDESDVVRRKCPVICRVNSKYKVLESISEWFREVTAAVFQP